MVRNIMYHGSHSLLLSIPQKLFGDLSFLLQLKVYLHGGIVAKTIVIQSWILHKSGLPWFGISLACPAAVSVTI